MSFIDNNLKPIPKYIEPDTDQFIDLVRSPLSKYNDEIIKSFGCLDNQGLALDDDDSGNGHVYIDQLYILPKASVKRVAPEDFANLEIENKSIKENQLQNIASLIRNNPRLILLGDPGIGKSTLVQWLVCSLSHVSENYAKKQIGNLFPLVLTSRKLNLNSLSVCLSNQDFLDAIITSQGEKLASHLLDKTPAKQVFFNALKSGQLILIIDGLDEISSTIKGWLSNQLRMLLLEFPKIHLLLTARVVGFNNAEFWQAGTQVDENKPDTETDNSFIDEDEISKNFNLPVVYFLAPFTPDQRLQFAKNWMKNYLPPNEEQKKQFIEGIIEVSKHSMQLNALSRIPVLLNLICFILWRRGKLPNGRAELYQRIVETYLVTMDRVRLLARELSDEYDFQDIKNWLAKLALQMQAGNVFVMDNALLSINDESVLEDLRNEFPEFKDERLLQISQPQLEGFIQLQLTEAVDSSNVRTHCTQLINYISTRTGFLIPKGQIDNEEHYSFSHLSFQEYFAAYGISKILPKLQKGSSKLAILIETLDQSEWSEIWQLVFEELSLNGSSRREIEQYLELLFISPYHEDEDKDKDEGDVERTTGLKYARNTTQATLYAKLITNPAIKISNNRRVRILIELTAYFTIYENSEKSIVFTLLSQIKNSFELYTTALKNETVLTYQDIKLDNWSWLTKLSELLTLNLTASNFTNLEYLKNNHQMRILYLGYSNVESLEHITDLSNLEKLFLHHSKVKSIKPLLKLTSLKELTLSSTKVSSIASLKDLQGLIRLDLSRTNITCIDALSTMDNLESLFLSFTNISDFSIIQKIETLNRLSLESTKIDDLKHISKLKNLKYLSVENTNIKDFSLLNKLTSITDLDLCDTNFSDLSFISDLRDLNYLNVLGCKIDNYDELLNFKKLTRLYINESELDTELLYKLRERSVQIMNA
jgi:internalin A